MSGDKKHGILWHSEDIALLHYNFAERMGEMKTDILIAGSGCSGLYCALKLPADKQILLITKADLESNDSFLAQGGICMLKDEDDFDDYFEDTLHAGHYENDKESVEIMIRSSGDIIDDLLDIGVDFDRDEDGELAFTREGAHSASRILFHEDITGREITSKLLAEAKRRSNITMMEYTTLIDIIHKDNVCIGAVLRLSDGTLEMVEADDVVMACGGIGGLYDHTTNFPHLTGDAVAIAIKHGIECKDLDYIQVHPTTLYSEDEGRSFLISESVRGEGARLYNKDMERFADELMPRDRLTNAIKKQMAKDGTEFVWEDMRTIPDEEIKSHFPNIAEHCQQQGYDVTKECIPVVPAQHYFMGGVKVNYESRTSMERLYAIGETACNGVHGRNRLASNSLLESLVFARRAAYDMADDDKIAGKYDLSEYVDMAEYADEDLLEERYRNLVLDEIKRMAEERAE